MSIATKKKTALSMACALVLSTAANANPITGALGEWKPIVDVRLRYETVEQDPPASFPEDAEALTIRARLGVETGKAWGTSLLVEGEFVTPIINDYRADPAVPKNILVPVISDPESYEVNRAQLVNTSIANTTFTLGRQRINIDDQRFVGNVGWRQNEQTYDALRFVNKPGGGMFTIDLTYANRVNRIFGDDSPQGDYTGDMEFANLSYQFRFGKLTGFGYVLDFDPLLAPVPTGMNPARVSSQTYGVRFAGEMPLSKIKLGYVASYAMQDEYGDNPVVIGKPHAMENDYYLGELSVTYKQFTLLVGDEILGGSGDAGFATPLATLHKFQGWVDKFLTTPVNGIDDKYAAFTTLFKGVGPLDTLTVVAVYHDYYSARQAFDFGSEINVSVAAKWNRFTGMLKYGDYSEDSTLYRDTAKLWAQVEFVW